MKLSWNEFKSQASSDLSSDGAYIYRGQRDPNWGLNTTLHRTALVRTIKDVKTYADFVLPQVHDEIEAWVGRSWDLGAPRGLAEFVAFIQHNGFPTPLLDWTSSPYIAAYFAFESVNHFAPQTESVAIFSFNQRAWALSFKQVYDYADLTPHVSILRPRILGNHKLAVQQGCFTFSSVPDIEAHVRLNEKDNKRFLTKYELDVREAERHERIELDGHFCDPTHAIRRVSLQEGS